MHPAHSVDNVVRIYEDAFEKLWVTHEELLLCGYRNIEDFDIIYANGKFYELQAYVRVAKSWWIEEVPTGDQETQAQGESQAHETAEGQPPPVSNNAGSPGRALRFMPGGAFSDPEA